MFAKGVSSQSLCCPRRLVGCCYMAAIILMVAKGFSKQLVVGRMLLHGCYDIIGGLLRVFLSSWYAMVLQGGCVKMDQIIQ